MILLSEKRLSLTELARREGVAIPTIWRWRKKGVRGVRLETIVVGNKPWTSEEAFERFVQGTTAAANGEVPSSESRTSRQRAAAVSRAERELEQEGI